MAFANVWRADYSTGPSAALGQSAPADSPWLWMTATVLLLIAVSAMAGRSPSSYAPGSETLGGVYRRRFR